ncbi:hypothetical protein F5884DRAFT_43326 [Xylogone sp. PMI_703]|nr:hypothetical protein F5884DRAFT_43326 [Xylogone sp. PMI_703]
MSAFSFSFTGDDIDDTEESQALSSGRSHAVETGSLRRSPAGNNSAFPVAGQPLLRPKCHSLESLLESLPSTISYSTLLVQLDDGQEMRLPRRELWDVRVQLMAEQDDEGLSNLKNDDIKTGVYEGGFKSWESSIDLVKVLAANSIQTLSQDARRNWGGKRILELGCGTALPSLATFQWHISAQVNIDQTLELGFADYNPTVLRLVTLPNVLLTWAYCKNMAHWEEEGEFEIDEDTVGQFKEDLKKRSVALSFFSGAWSPEFVQITQKWCSNAEYPLTILGAETIYSPTALGSFAETVMEILSTLQIPGSGAALVGAKTVYFGVGGSMEDFIQCVIKRGGTATRIREESDGVRREVVEVRTK